MSEVFLDGKVLGSMELAVRGTPVAVRAPKERLLLALFLCRPGACLPPEQLMDELWGDRLPGSARKNLQVYVSALRKRVGERLEYDGWGYRLHLDRQELDVLRFEQLATDGRNAARAGDLAEGADLWAEAIALWRGEPLVEFANSLLVSTTAAQWTNRFLGIYEAWAEYEIAAGRSADIMSGLDALVERHPERERLVGARMSALAWCGRTTEAVHQFLGLRRHLAEELGVDPSRGLMSLYEDILAGRIGAAASGTAAWQPTGATPSQLPRGISDFVGRADELDRLETTDAAVTVVSGEVGIGKTTLAVQAAHRLRHRYPDGAQVVLLGPRASSAEGVQAVLHEQLATLGVRLDGTEGAAAVQAVWRSRLADQRMLVLLDDAPDESAVRAFLPGTPEVKVLVTSRRRLSGLESVERLPLAEFQIEKATEFLSLLLAPRRLGARRDAVAQLLERWGRSPATLRIIGQRLAGLADPYFDALLDRLTSSEDVLDEFAAGDRSLRRILTACYGAPDWDLGAAFRTLGVLPPPPFDHGLLITALADQELDPGPAIEALLEAGVLAYPDGGEIVAHSTNYAMSPLAHRFAAELASCRQGAESS